MLAEYFLLAWTVALGILSFYLFFRFKEAEKKPFIAGDDTAATKFSEPKTDDSWTKREEDGQSLCFGPKLVVFSGGTAFNCIVHHVSELLSTRVSHVLTISDNGGSSREIIRVLGGPAIGDMRSRLVRLAGESTNNLRALKYLLEYRLTTSSVEEARQEMYDIVTGNHAIWRGVRASANLVNSKKASKFAVSTMNEVHKQTMRAFLVYFWEACSKKESNFISPSLDRYPANYESYLDSVDPEKSSGEDLVKPSVGFQFSPFPSTAKPQSNNSQIRSHADETVIDPQFAAPRSPNSFQDGNSRSRNSSNASIFRSPSPYTLVNPKDMSITKRPPLGGSKHIHSGVDNGFDFRGGSVGNFVFTGARLFFSSLTAAIFWFSNLVHIPPSAQVMPVIIANTRVTIGAKLANGDEIIGQDEISHPHVVVKEEAASSSVPGSESSGLSQKSCNIVNKSHSGQIPLAAPIERIYYVNPSTQKEITPIGNPAVFSALEDAEAVIYSMGSLYTSIIPSLIVPGVGSRIQQSKVPKILVLNGCWDRESFGMDLADYVYAIILAIQQGHRHLSQRFKTRSYSMDYMNISGAIEDTTNSGSSHLGTHLNRRDLSEFHHFASCESFQEPPLLIQPQQILSNFNTSWVRSPDRLGLLATRSIHDIPQSKSPLEHEKIDSKHPSYCVAEDFGKNYVSDNPKSNSPPQRAASPSKVQSHISIGNARPRSIPHHGAAAAAAVQESINISSEEGTVNDIMLSPPLPDVAECFPLHSARSQRNSVDRKSKIFSREPEPVRDSDHLRQSLPVDNPLSKKDSKSKLMEMQHSVREYVTHVLFVDNSFVRENMVTSEVLDVMRRVGVDCVAVPPASPLPVGPSASAESSPRAVLSRITSAATTPMSLSGAMETEIEQPSVQESSHFDSVLAVTTLKNILFSTCAKQAQ